MKAARITQHGHADVVQIVELERPVPGAGQVLVEVRASSINPIDVKIREGSIRGMPGVALPMTLGSDVAGVVVELGAGTTAFAVGDEVYGSASVTAGGTGAFAHFAATPATAIARKPRTVGFVEAASLALTGSSAVQAVQDHLRLRRGQRVLIHGAAGGIGTIAVQLARHVGAHITATARGVDMDFVRRLGVDEVIDVEVRDFTEERPPFDAVLDTVGGDHYERSFEAMKRGGTMASLVHAPDRETAARHGVTAVTMMTRITTADLDNLRRLIDEGVITARIDQRFTFEHLRDAFEAKERHHVHGKVAVEIGPPRG